MGKYLTIASRTGISARRGVTGCSYVVSGSASTTLTGDANWAEIDLPKQGVLGRRDRRGRSLPICGHQYIRSFR